MLCEWLKMAAFGYSVTCITALYRYTEIHSNPSTPFRVPNGLPAGVLCTLAPPTPKRIVVKLEDDELVAPTVMGI